MKHINFSRIIQAPRDYSQARHGRLQAAWGAFRHYFAEYACKASQFWSFVRVKLAFCCPLLISPTQKTFLSQKWKHMDSCQDLKQWKIGNDVPNDLTCLQLDSDHSFDCLASKWALLSSQTEWQPFLPTINKVVLCVKWGVERMRELFVAFFII